MKHSLTHMGHVTAVIFGLRDIYNDVGIVGYGCAGYLRAGYLGGP